MKIGIIGGGAIGLLFTYFLQLDHEVTIYTRTKEQRDKLNSDGLILTQEGLDHHVKIKAKCVCEWNANEQLTLITVKQYQLSSVINQITQSTELEQASFLFLQNGMGHLSLLTDLQAKNIYVGSVEHGALRMGYNHVSFTGKGLTKTAVFKGEESLLKQLLTDVDDRFPFQFEKDYEEMLISKLVVNAVINPLTGVLKIYNGQLIDNPNFHNLSVQLFNEVVEVLELGHREAHFFNILLNVCRKTSKNRSSMLKDIEESRPTEVDAILGYLIERAKKNNRAAPLITAFYHCIKGMEESL